MVAKGVKMHYFQDVVHKKLIKQMGAEFHNYGARMGEIRWDHVARDPGCFTSARGIRTPGGSTDSECAGLCGCGLGAQQVNGGNRVVSAPPHAEFRFREFSTDGPCACRAVWMSAGCSPVCARRERATTGSDNLKIPDAFSKNRGLAKPLQLLPATAALLPYLLEATRAIGEPPCLYPPLGGARLGPRVCVCVCVCVCLQVGSPATIHTCSVVWCACTVSFATRRLVRARDASAARLPQGTTLRDGHVACSHARW